MSAIKTKTRRGTPIANLSPLEQAIDRKSGFCQRCTRFARGVQQVRTALGLTNLCPKCMTGKVSRSDRQNRRIDE